LSHEAQIRKDHPARRRLYVPGRLCQSGARGFGWTQVDRSVSRFGRSDHRDPGPPGSSPERPAVLDRFDQSRGI